MPLELIIDTDGGIDDAQALLLALSRPDTEVAALTTVSGNIDVEQATRNILSVLDVTGCGPPVYQGAAGPLLGVTTRSNEL